jgi:hypothetical protein
VMALTNKKPPTYEQALKHRVANAYALSHMSERGLFPFIAKTTELN